MTNQIEQILVIKHGALGDIIQANGILKNIRKHHSSARITLLTSSKFYSLMNKCPYINNIIIDDRYSLINIFKQASLLKKLYVNEFSLVYDLQNSFRTLVYQNFFLRSVKWITTNRKHHQISGLRGLIDMLAENNISTVNTLNPDISWMANNVTKILKEKKITGNYIILIPGSSKNHAEKRWPYYNKLAELLMKQKWKIITILGPDEKELKKTSAGFIFDNLSWQDLAGIIKSSAYVIGNDTGPIHVASCLGKPGLAIFGPSTSDIRSELKREKFNVLKVNALSELSALEVYEKAMKDLNLQS